VIRDLLEAIPKRAIVADVCVVGAGAAGIALAVELRRAGKSVILLEGGGAEVEALAQEPYASEVAALAHRGIHNGRFRAKGGTTTRWGGQILELEDWDFAQRGWIAGSGWPFAKATLQPFYQQALELEGVDGAIAADAEVWRELGVPEPSFAVMQSYLSRWCPEPNFARLHGAALAQDDGLQVWLHTNVTALEFENETAVSVRARTQSGREAFFRAREFVFCLGAIESSRFFLQPREGAIPWNRSGLLGRHFQDHIDCNVGQMRPRAGSRRELDRCFDGIFLHGFKYQPKIKLAHAEQERAETLNVAAALAYESDSDAALTELRTTAKQVLRGRLGEVSAGSVGRAVANAPALLRQSWRYAVEHRSYQPASAKISLRVHCEQEPCSASTITLSGERDSLGLYRTRLCWKISALELKTIRHFAEVAGRALAPTAELEPLAGMGEDAALTAACEDSYHHMGGMRMNDSPTQGVVDTNLKLHGTKNAYVLSSAVFPTSGFSNPTHTLLALAVRLAGRLSQAGRG
jgi:choline dehydrogenase-like flavoprotein